MILFVMQSSNINHNSRRSFLAKLITLISGSIGIILGTLVAGFAISPALKKKEKDWIEIGEILGLEADTPKQVVYYYMKKDGWLEKRVKSLVYVLKNEKDEITVFSPTCSHLGCSVRWNEERRQFLCPCHGGVYDINGRVVAGPPPKPLSRYKVKFEKEKLFVMES